VPATEVFQESEINDYKLLRHPCQLALIVSGLGIGLTFGKLKAVYNVVLCAGQASGHNAVVIPLSSVISANRNARVLRSMFAGKFHGTFKNVTFVSQDETYLANFKREFLSSDESCIWKGISKIFGSE
jgi:hypothetical protein